MAHCNNDAGAPRRYRQRRLPTAHPIPKGTAMTSTFELALLDVFQFILDNADFLGLLSS